VSAAPRRSARSTASPWSWHGALEPWFESLRPRTAAWRPADELELDAPGLLDALVDAVDRRESWLWHPCVATLTLASSGRRWQRDLQLVLWAALHRGLTGRVTLPAPTRTWVAAGGELPAGRRELAEDAAGASRAEESPAIQLDPWCTTVGEPLPGSWAEQPPVDDAGAERLSADVVRYLRAFAFLDAQLPACRAWLVERTKVAVPLLVSEDAHHSISFPDIPALVGLDLGSDLLVLESLVHESAHLNLFLEEAAGPLVDPADEGRFHSPLRRDPRPLRGILLAYHALAFMTALYADALAATGAAIFEGQVASTIVLARDAERTLVVERHRLTESGRRFLALTQEVAAYGER
jgi:HEXXH motif-containing protein